MNNNDQAPRRLSHLQAALEAAGYDCSSTGYRRHWIAAVDRRIPAHQMHGIWHYLPQDVPEIATRLNLPRREQDEAQSPQTAAA